MSNPATLLADLLSQWDVPKGSTAEEVRGEPNAGSLNFWTRHGHAVELLREIEREITAMEACGRDVEDLRVTLPAWYRAVFAANTPWGTRDAGNRHVIAPSDLRMLRMLGQWIDDRNTAPPLLADEITEIGGVLDDAYELIRGSETLAVASRGYLLALVKEAKDFLAGIETYGTVQVRKAVFELSGAMVSHATTQGDQQEATKWTSAAVRLVNKIGGPTALAVMGGVAGQLTQIAIGS